MSYQEGDFFSLAGAHESWVKSQGLPVYKGYYVEDLKTVELGQWKERNCSGAFFQLSGLEHIIEIRVTEIPPGGSLPPLRFAFDEEVYVIDGRGLTTVWSDGMGKKTFEWQKHSMFLLPRNFFHQLSNAHGDKPARLLHYNYFPTCLASIPAPDFFFSNPSAGLDHPSDEEAGIYSEARFMRKSGDLRSRGRRDAFWYGNLFANLKSWDKLETHQERSMGGHVVMLRHPHSSMWSHMAVFPALTYKKAHRHGPGAVITVIAGEGYSIMWQEENEKVVIPWHEDSLFVPPGRWFHQHFNSGSSPARYLAFHGPKLSAGYGERIENMQRDQIEYPDEEAWIREKFEKELTDKGLQSAMPKEAYTNRDFKWQYKKDG